MPESERTAKELGIIFKVSHCSVSDTASRLIELIEAKGLKLFSVIDQRTDALVVGLELRDARLVIFGSPGQGTPVMEAEQLSALDLSLNVLVWDDNGTTRLTYYSPDLFATPYQLDPGIAENLAGLDPLTDAPVQG
jgi:uncharacterized protein (DUF302 family)